MSLIKYIALTIGPIAKTQKKAKKTRELWAASYIFSYIMKQIVLQLSGRNKNKPETLKRMFLIPYVENEKIFTSHTGAGLFPDRIIFKAEDNDFEKIPTVIDNALQITAFVISHKLEESPSLILKYLHQYFKIYAIEKDIDDSVNPIKLLSEDLDVLECQENFAPIETADWLQKFFDQINGTYLYYDGFENQISAFANEKQVELISKQLKDDANRRFPTLIEISLSQFFKTDNVDSNKEAENAIKVALQQERQNNKKSGDEEDAIYKNIKSLTPFKNELFNYHKYIAIVKIDGDSFGKTNDELYNINKTASLSDFNSRMLNFNIEAIDAITNYGGKPIYLGGDDIMFFAPVANATESIFDLIHTIDTVFGKNMVGISPCPTLSSGVSLVYYKFPLYEALEEAEDLLNEHAKKDFYKINETKNAVSFNLMKHSRRGYKATFQKNSGVNALTLFDEFRDLIKLFRKEEKLFSSMHQTLRGQKDFINLIGEIKIIDDKKIAIENYFDNTFNEKIHDSNRVNINKIKDFILNIYNSGLYPENALDTALSALRFVKFITEKDNDND